MIRHYLIVSWRNIVRNKFYTVILVLGLAVGIAASLLLGIYTWNELTYDNFHEKKERIFLVGVREKEGENESEGGWTTPPTGPALQEFFEEIEASVRLCTWFEDVVVTKDDKTSSENNIIGADSSIFRVFTIPFIAGDPRTALREPNTIVITEKIARKYFGDKSPLGQTLHFDQFFQECKITGIVKDLPSNSHFGMDILLSLSSLRTINFDFNHWQNHTFSTYVLLHKKSKPKDIERRLPQFVQKHLDPYLIQKYKKSYAEIFQHGDYYSLFLMPLKDVHLSTMLFENREGKRTLTYALGIISLVIVVLVGINYTNLATVLTFSRSKEAGIRKVSGSRSESLFKQFLMESILMVFIGVFIALGLVEIILPFFNNLTQQHLTLNYLNPWVILGLMAFAVTMGLLSGLYPAVRFSSLNPIQALKGNTTLKSKNSWFRNVLVIFQFTICITMIVSTLVVYKQFNFMTNKSLGFDKEQVLVIRRAGALNDNKAAFKNELLNYSGISSVSFAETTPGRHFNGHGQHFAGTPSDESQTIFPLVADEDILQTLDIKIVAGRGFKDHELKNEKAILNEAAVRMLNLENPLEQKIDNGTLGKKEVEIIGIAKDFHFKSFHFSIEPLVIYNLDIENDSQHRATFILVKLSSSELPAMLQNIQDTWKKYTQTYPFEYSFLDQDFNRLFERENIMMKVYAIFSGISISIACLGLLGLASFFVSKKTKEIGIRKIVGASFLNITSILSRDFTRWIIASILLGSTLSWYLMHQWLQNFAYQTDLDWWIFLIAGICVMLIAAITVTWHIYRAANRNPVETLRYE
jgi:putative ABC transport system permease protein